MTQTNLSDGGLAPCPEFKPWRKKQHTSMIERRDGFGAIQTF